MRCAALRILRRLTVASIRRAEAIALLFGRRPWKIDKFNRLIHADVQTAVRTIRSASVIVGIPFHREAGNIAALVEKTQRDLESRSLDAAVVIVGERKTRSVLMGADVAVANYIRRIDEDDAIIHLWDRLMFGAVFRKWIAFRHGGDYAISRKIVPGILGDPSIMRERAYTMDSAVMAHVVRRGGRIEPVWLSAKEHEPITRLNLFNRLQSLVHSVFDDVDAHLSVVLTLSRKAALVQPPEVPVTTSRMRDLIGAEFRQDLHRDMAMRFRAAADDIRKTLGTTACERFSRIANDLPTEQVVLSPQHWSKATFRLLARYVRSRDGAKKARLARACVPILEGGILDFLNRTYDLAYGDALHVLDTEYLPVFQRNWESLSGRLLLYRLSLLRRWPVRMAIRFGNVIGRLCTSIRAGGGL